MKWKRISINGILFLWGYFLGNMIVRKPNLGATSCQTSVQDGRPHPLHPGADGSLMIGVMTTRSQLTTRASAIYSTWGRNISAFILFYIGQSSTQEALKFVTNSKKDEHINRRKGDEHLWSHRKEPIQWMNGLPVVELQEVIDDGYPPRDKNFAMLSHMMHNFGSNYQWFLRSDDDVYVRVEKLVQFLLSLDSSLPWYIGRPGIGKAKEKGHLGLKKGKPYCMGGPGAIFSSVTLSKLVPHLQDCAGEVVTPHEDTEVGRCVFKHLGISCTTVKKKMSELFRHVRDKDNVNDLGHLLHSCLTIHPFKEPGLMYELHIADKLQQLQALQSHEQQLMSSLKNVNGKWTSTNSGLNHFDTVGFKHPSRRRAVSSFTSEKPSLQEDRMKSLWDIWHKVADVSVVEKTFASTDSKADAPLEENPVWGYAIFRRPYSLEGTKTHHPTMKKAIYIARDQVRKFTKDVNIFPIFRRFQIAMYQSCTLTHGLQRFITLADTRKGYQSFLLSSRFDTLHWREISVKHDGTTAQNLNTETEYGSQVNHNKKGIQTKRDSDPLTSSWPTLHVLLTLHGRHQTYLRFLNYLTTAATHYPADVHLRVTIYSDPLGEHELSSKASAQNKHLKVNVLILQDDFSRAEGLTAAAKGLNGSSVLIILDVDMIFNEQFLYRAASNVVLGSAYFPICYSQYSPETVCYGRSKCIPEPFDFSQDTGLWRVNGKGMSAIRASDFWRAGGFNTSVTGWGFEDVEFYDRCIKLSIPILRAPDPALVHVYHDIACNPSLSEKKLTTCTGVSRYLYGSAAKLTEMVSDLKHL